MSQFQSPSTPPDDLDELLAEQPKWPKVVGIISIVWGSLGIMCNGCGVLQNLGGGGPAAQQGPQYQPTTLDLLNAGAGFLLTIVLIIAGVLCVSRNPIARSVHLFYGLVSLPLAGYSVFRFTQIYNQFAQWVQNNPDQDFAKMWPMVSTVMIVMGGAGFLLALIWPVFCVIWFGLVKRRPEDVTGTAPPPAA